MFLHTLMSLFNCVLFFVYVIVSVIQLSMHCFVYVFTHLYTF